MRYLGGMYVPDEEPSPRLPKKARSPFGKILYGLWIAGLWAAILGGLSFGGYACNERQDRIHRHHARHTWAHIGDKDAAVEASDALVNVYGQGEATRIRPLGPPTKTSVAGGRHEWRFRYDVPEGPLTDAGTACVYVWKQKNGYGDYVPHHTVVTACR